MAETIANIVASHLENLSATNPICIALGTTFTSSNLTIGFEPDGDNDNVAIVPFGGGPPNIDRLRQNPSVQLRMKTNSRQRGLSTQQEFIDHFSYRTVKKKTLFSPIQSAPSLLKTLENGKWVVYVSNYNVKYMK